MQIGAVVKPTAARNAQSGIAEAIRCALDYWLDLPADRRRAAKRGEDNATLMTSLWLLPDEAAVLDGIVALFT